MQREIAIMKELDHICLIRLHEVIDEADGDKLCMSKKPDIRDYVHSYRLCQIWADHGLGLGFTKVLTLLQRKALVFRERHLEDS